jgi:hypothetical protein
MQHQNACDESAMEYRLSAGRNLIPGLARSFLSRIQSKKMSTTEKVHLTEEHNVAVLAWAQGAMKPPATLYSSVAWAFNTAVQPVQAVTHDSMGAPAKFSWNHLLFLIM